MSLFMTEIDSLLMLTHTFVRNVAGDIVPEVQSTTKHAHLFNALFHIPQDTCFRQTHARNHL